MASPNNINNSKNSNDGCGYHENLFISPPPDHLRCSICSFVVHNPVLILDCGHKYCSVCFERLKASTTLNHNTLQCPVDRNVIDPTRVFEDVALKRQVGNLHVRCQGSEKGCDWSGELTELEVHAGKCQYLCLPTQQQLPSHSDEIMWMICKLTERIEKNEAVIMERDKEISRLKYTLTGKVQEIDELKKAVGELKDGSTDLRKEIQEKEEKHNQQFAAMGRQLAAALKNIGQLVTKVDEVENRNNKLEVEFGESKKRQESFKHEMEMKSNASLEKCSFLENKVKHLEELLDVKDTKKDLALVLPKGTSVSSKNRQQQQPQSKKVLLMQPRNDKNHGKVIISNDNRIEFKGYGTVTLVVGVVVRGRKAFYEVNVLKECGCYLSVGWATKGFITSGCLVGGNKHSYSYAAHSEFSYRYHEDIGQPYGVHLMEGGQNIIGVALDMSSGEILFGHNGQWHRPMGIAFNFIDTTKNYFPAISYGNGEIQVNFGEKDFVYGPPHESFINLLDIV